MYTNKSLASNHKYIVLQAKPRIGVDGGKYVHFQIPGPAVNRDYGYVFDLPVEDEEHWEELVKVCAKVEVDVTLENEEHEKAKTVAAQDTEDDTYDIGEDEENDNEQEEETEEYEDLVKQAVNLQDALDKIMGQYGDQIHGA
jgi:hypothetical protein